MYNLRKNEKNNRTCGAVSHSICVIVCLCSISRFFFCSTLSVRSLHFGGAIWSTIIDRHTQTHKHWLDRIFVHSLQETQPPKLGKGWVNLFRKRQMNDMSIGPTVTGNFSWESGTGYLMHMNFCLNAVEENEREKRNERNIVYQRRE